MLPGPGGALVLVGETGQVLSDGWSALRPAVVEQVLLQAVLCSEEKQMDENVPFISGKITEGHIFQAGPHQST